MEYAPVCGVKDGAYKTYGNGCTLAADKAVHQHQGECTADELANRGKGEYVPPAHCTAWSDGCNSCGRDAEGRSFCTLRACVGAQGAGYCTAYGDTEDTPAPAAPSGNVGGPVNQPTVDAPSASTGVAATATATTTDEARPGFFARVWAGIAAWFGGLF
jgi:hypothetical protein